MYKTKKKMPAALANKYHKDHPFLNAESHQKLLEYVNKRTKAGFAYRDAHKGRMITVDKHIAGFMQLTPDDQTRKTMQDSKGLALPTSINVPVMQAQLVDMLTYMLQVYAPASGMFSSSGDVKQMNAGKAVLREMENHATHTGQYLSLKAACWAILKYNLGGLHTHWDYEVTEKAQRVWAGNRADAIDPYNTFWDQHVPPHKVSEIGEFAGFVMRVSAFALRQDYFKGKLDGAWQYLDVDDYTHEGTDQTGGESSYYINPPDAANMVPQTSDGTDSESVDWGMFLGTSVKKVGAVERIVSYFRLNPYELNLIPRNALTKAERNRIEVWRLEFAEGKYLLRAEFVDSLHGRIPIQLASPNYDEMEFAQKSDAEIVNPFQTFISYLFNTHMHAIRGNLYGILAYNSSLVPLDQIPAGDTAGRLPIAGLGSGVKLDDVLKKIDTQINTTDLLNQVDYVLGLVNKIAPKQLDANQVAGIDRAIKSQVSAAKQGANRAVHLKARLVDYMMLQGSRVCSYYNILQNLESGLSYGGNTYSAEDIQSTGLEYVLGHGLKMLDKEIATEGLKEIIFILMQNPQTAQAFDIPKLLNYLTDNMDLDTNLEGFRAQTQPEESDNGTSPAVPTDNAEGSGDPAGIAATLEQPQ